MTSDESCRSESLLACDLEAISVSDRPRYGELRRMVAAAITAKRELPDGIAVQIATERFSLGQLAEWILLRAQVLPVFRLQNRRRATIRAGVAEPDGPRRRQGISGTSLRWNRKIAELKNDRAEFIEPMLALAVTKLPEGPAWSYELKFDGYRALGLKANGRVRLLSRQRLHFSLVSIARCTGSATRIYGDRWRDRRFLETAASVTIVLLGYRV
jgi:hypothetical protein